MIKQKEKGTFGNQEGILKTSYIVMTNLVMTYRTFFDGVLKVLLQE